MELHLSVFECASSLRGVTASVPIIGRGSIDIGRRVSRFAYEEMNLTVVLSSLTQGSLVYRGPIPSRRRPCE